MTVSPVEDELPAISQEVLLAILSSGFCSGKTISTLLLNVALCNHRLRPGATALCRGILVQRLIELAAKFVGVAPDVKDVIDAIREDCRLSSRHGVALFPPMKSMNSILPWHLAVKNKTSSTDNEADCKMSYRVVLFSSAIGTRKRVNKETGKNPCLVSVTA
jgi:hypothetical protein